MNIDPTNPRSLSMASTGDLLRLARTLPKGSEKDAVIAELQHRHDETALRGRDKDGVFDGRFDYNLLY